MSSLPLCMGLRQRSAHMVERNHYGTIRRREGGKDVDKEGESATEEV